MLKGCDIQKDQYEVWTYGQILTLNSNTLVGHPAEGTPYGGSVCNFVVAADLNMAQ